MKLTMESFQIVALLTLTLILMESLNPITARPADVGKRVPSSPFNRDYLTLQAILGKNLVGTANEKARVVDLLLQLLEEIDLPTLCEVIINDTKGTGGAFSQFQIQSTKIDASLVNELRSHLVTDIQKKVASPKQHINNIAISSQNPISDETYGQLTIPKHGKQASKDLHDVETLNEYVVPATYKYHRNELKYVHQDLHGNRPPSIDHSFIDVKHSQELSSGNPELTINKEEFPSGKSVDRPLPKFSLPKQEIDSIDIDPSYSHRERKQVYLRSIGSQLPQDGDTNMAIGYTNDVKYKNGMVKNVDTKRPQSEVFSQSLVLGDWADNQGTFSQNLDTFSQNLDTRNGASVNNDEVMNGLENYVENEENWSVFDKSESQIRTKPTQHSIEHQPKYMRWYKQDGDGQMFGQMTTPSDKSGMANSLSSSQREVDYMEELRSTFKDNKEVANLPSDRNKINGFQENGGSNVEQPDVKVGYEQVVRGSILDTATVNRLEKLATPMKYGTVKEDFKNVVNRNVAVGETKWGYNSDSTSSSRPSPTSSEETLTEQTVMADSIQPRIGERKVYSYLSRPTTSQESNDMAALSVTNRTELTKDSSDAVQMERGHDNTRTTALIDKQEEFQTASPVTQKADSGLKGPNTIVTFDQQASMLEGLIRSTGLAKLAKRHYPNSQGNQTSDNVFITLDLTGHIVSSESQHLDYTTQDPRNSRHLSDKQTSTDITEIKAIGVSERNPVNFYSATLMQKMEANMKAASPSAMSISDLEKIVNLQNIDEQSGQTMSTKAEKDVSQIKLANTSTLQSREDDLTINRNRALNKARQFSTDSFVSAQTTTAASHLHSTRTSTTPLTEAMRIKFDTDLDTFVGGSRVDNGDINGYQNDNSHVTAGSEIIRNTTSKTESSFRRAPTNQTQAQSQMVTKVRVPAVLYNHLTSHQLSSSQNQTVAPYVNKVILTSAPSEDIMTNTVGIVTKTNDNDTTPASTTHITHFPQDISTDTHITTSISVRAVANTSEMQPQSKSIAVGPNIALDIAHISGDESNLFTTWSPSSTEPGSHLPRNNIFNQRLAIVDTNTNITDANLNMYANLQTISTNPESHKIDTYISTTARSVTEDMTSSISATSQNGSKQTSDFSHLIKPVYVDYGKNTPYSQMSTAPTTADQKPAEINVIGYASNLEHIQSNLLDSRASQNIDKKAKITSRVTDTKWIMPSSSEYKTSIIVSSVTDNRIEKGTSNKTSAKPTILMARSEVASLLQRLSHRNITSDSLKAIASRIAQTKANLSEINSRLLNQAAQNAQHEHKTEKVIDRHVSTRINENVNAFNEVQLSKIVPKADEQLARFTFFRDSLGWLVTQNNDASTTTSSIQTNEETEAPLIMEPTSVPVKTSTSADIIKELAQNTEYPTAPGKTTSGTTSFPLNSTSETATTSLLDSSDKPISERNHLKDNLQNTTNDYPGGLTYSHSVQSEKSIFQRDRTTSLESSTSAKMKPETWNKGHDSSGYTQAENLIKKLNTHSDISDSTDGVTAQTKLVTLLDPWKAYNIALGRSKAKQQSQDITEHTGVPEIHLYSDYRFGPSPGYNTVNNYLWKAGPWTENKLSHQDQNTKYYQMLAGKTGLYQNKNVDERESVGYQTKNLNKIHSLSKQAEKIKHANIWGNRFSQGYYGRVVHDPSTYRKPSDSSSWLPFQSQEMVNFDMPSKNTQDLKGFAIFKNLQKKNILKQGRELKPSNNLDWIIYPRYKDTVKTFPSYSGHQFSQESQNTKKFEFLNRHKTMLGITSKNPVNRGTHVIKNDTSAALDTDEMNQWQGGLQAASIGVPAHEDYKCPGLFGYHKDPQNCQAFFICSWGMAHRVVCPQGTLYNSKEAVCDWAVNVRCAVNDDNIPSHRDIKMTSQTK